MTKNLRLQEPPRRITDSSGGSFGLTFLGRGSILFSKHAAEENQVYRIQPMNPEFAGEIARWKYPDEYSVYSFEPSPELITELLNGSYYSCTDEHGWLIGYYCFGHSAQIPTAEDYPYDDDSLDIGLGLSPEGCGMGLGASFLRPGLDFAART